MRFQKCRAAAAGCFSAFLLISSISGLPGFLPGAGGSLTASASVQAAVPFSTSSVARTEGGGANGSGQDDKAYQAIREITSSADVPGGTRITLNKYLASADARPAYSFVKQDYGYRALSSDSERTLYEYIDNAAYQVSNQSVSGYYPVGQIVLTAKLDQSRLQKVFLAYTNDHPEVFWLTNVFSYGYDGDSSILQLFSVLSADGCREAVNALNSKLQQVIQSVPAGLSEFDREEALYDYLTKNCSYNDAAVEDTSIWQAFTAYGALMDGHVVCEGYSRAMELLSSYLGLHCTLIRGSSNGVGHMWNAVSIGENWYHLDLTWCDGNQPIYNYFNVTDQVIRQTHKISPAYSSLTEQQLAAANSQVNLFLPACQSTAENYYVVKGIKITDLGNAGDSTVVQQLSADLAESDPTVAFYIDAGPKFTSVANGLVSASPYKMKTYLQQACRQSGKSPENVSYVVDSANHGLEICVTY
ncbi:hypothetical protein A7X67_18270 [Clostridium sp. W14A]|nr:hypothetical protein A7X67_18270 [Clostridium sp. W14A]